MALIDSKLPRGMTNEAMRKDAFRFNLAALIMVTSSQFGLV
jgi:hypothetical protein